MRKLILFCLIFIFLTIPAYADKVKIDLPDAKAGFYYCFVDKELAEGASSEIVTYKIIAIEVGIVKDACLIGGTIKLADLKKWGLNYKWVEVGVSVGGWLGYNFEKEKIKGGIYASLLKVKF